MESGSQKATLVVVVVAVVVVGISSLKISQGYLNTQRSATKLCVHIHAHIPSDFQLT